MKPKNLATVLLLAFVGVSVIVVLAKETGSRSSSSLESEASTPPSAQGETPGSDAGSVTAAAATRELNADDSATPGDSKASDSGANLEGKYVVAYLHGRARCGPCRTLQSYAMEAVSEHFADELADGTMEWRVINVATPEYGHLSQHYEIFTQSVIVSEMRGDTEVRWKNLDRIWQLVRDREAYFEYIRAEVEEFRSKS